MSVYTKLRKTKLVLFSIKNPGSENVKNRLRIDDRSFFTAINRPQFWVVSPNTNININSTKSALSHIVLRDRIFENKVERKG